MPRNRVPDTAKSLPWLTAAGTVLSVGCHEGLNPSPMSNSSALAVGPKLLSSPPATRTFPLGSSVVVWYSRAVTNTPAGAHVPVAGSYSSQEPRKPLLLLDPKPPATRTLPSGRRMAVCLSRAIVIEPVTLHAPVFGSYNSALFR